MSSLATGNALTAVPTPSFAQHGAPGKLPMRPHLPPSPPQHRRNAGHSLSAIQRSESNVERERIVLANVLERVKTCSKRKNTQFSAATGEELPARRPWSHPWEAISR